MSLINQSDTDRRWKHLPLNIRKFDLVVDPRRKFGLLVGRIGDEGPHPPCNFYQNCFLGRGPVKPHRRGEMLFRNLITCTVAE